MKLTTSLQLCGAGILCAVLATAATAPGQVTAVWNGDGDGFSYSDPNNWNIDWVPINDANTYIVQIGAGAAVTFDVPDPIAGTNQIYQFSLAEGSALSLQGRNLQVTDSAAIGGTVNATSGSLVANHIAGSVTGGRMQILVDTSANPSDSAAVTLGASGTYYATDAAVRNSVILSADGPNATLGLPFLATVDAYVDHNGTNARTISAANGGTINLSNVTTLRGGSGTWGGTDSVHVTATTGGVIDLSKLQQTEGIIKFTTDSSTFTLPKLASASAVTYSLPDNATLSLPELMSQDGGGLDVTTGTTVSAPKLEKLENAYISFSSPGTVNAPLLTDFSGSILTLTDAAQAVTTGGLSDIDNARFILSNGTTFSQITDTSYIITSATIRNTTVMGADGAGTNLDASSLTLIDAYADHNGTNARTISATNGGTIDLSNVTTLRGGSGTWGGTDSVHVTATTGGVIDLSKLQQTEGIIKFTTDSSTFTLPKLGSASAVTYSLPDNATLSLPELMSQDGGGFDVTTGTTVSAPKLEKLENAYISFSSPGTVNAPLLTDFSGSTLTLTDPAQVVTTGGLSDIDNARFILSNGTTFSQITDTSYIITNAAVASQTVMGADGAGTSLDASALTQIDSYVDFNGTNARTISATNGGTIDLSNVTTLRGGSGTWGGTDSLRVTATGGGVIDLSSFQENEGITYLTAASGGILRLGNLVMTSGMAISADGLNSRLEMGDFMLQTGASLSVTDGASLAITGDLQNELTDGGQWGFDTGIVRVDGAGAHWYEVAGVDLGVGGATSGNFGLMQLVLGSDAGPAMVQLTDIYDNDGAGQGSLEVLYLYGSGGLDGLEIYNGSTLVIGGVQVYALMDGNMVELHDLFGLGETVISFDSGLNNGFIAIPEPITLSLLATGALALIRRRKRR